MPLENFLREDPTPIPIAAYQCMRGLQHLLDMEREDAIVDILDSDETEEIKNLLIAFMLIN